MAGTAAVLAACGPAPLPPPPLLPHPNGPRTIVVIIADDMRFDYRTRPRPPGRQLDRLRQRGHRGADVRAVARRAVQGPGTPPAPGVIGNSSTYLMNDTDTIATRIHAPGYRTVLSGKYLNDFPWTGRRRTCRRVGTSGTRPARPTSPEPDGTWATDYVFHFAAEQVLATPATTPMFLWVGPTDPHLPANPPARYANTSRHPAAQVARRSTRPTSATSRPSRSSRC